MLRKNMIVLQRISPD